MRDTSRDGCWGNKPPEPPRAGAAELKVPRHWTEPVWRLRCALLDASRRLPRGTGLQALLEGTERYVKLTGRGRPGPGYGSPESVAWWRDVMGLVQVVGAIADGGTRALLAPWLEGGARYESSAAAGEGFRPFGA